MRLAGPFDKNLGLATLTALTSSLVLTLHFFVRPCGWKFWGYGKEEVGTEEEFHYFALGPLLHFCWSTRHPNSQPDSEKSKEKP